MAKRELDNSPEAKAKRVRTSRRAHRKGNAFELLCAHKIVDAAGAPFEKKDCYRTPQSGGHRFAGANDLQISGRLLAIFPFGWPLRHVPRRQRGRGGRRTVSRLKQRGFIPQSPGVGLFEGEVQLYFFGTLVYILRRVQDEVEHGETRAR